MGKFKVNVSLSIITAVVLSLFFLSGCSKDNKSTTPNTSPPEGNPGTIVVISNFTYSPSSLTISAGDTVTWRNDDSVGHTVTSDSGSELNSSLLGQGQTYTHIFGATGNFPYHCTVHPNMTASVTVQ